MAGEDLIAAELKAIRILLERLVPPAPAIPDFTIANHFVWQPETSDFYSVESVHAWPLDILQGLEAHKDVLVNNTLQFAQGGLANNALLWGAPGMGKSSLIKTVHAHVNEYLKHHQQPLLKLVELNRDDIETLTPMLRHLKAAPFRFLILCDDLSFEGADARYKGLKSALEGGIEGKPANVLVYATSNRRHILAREMIENEQRAAIHATEVIDEKVSLADRFGLWLGVHACSEELYHTMVRSYAQYFNLKISDADLIAAANLWARERGARSGRVAWQFVQCSIK